MMRSTTSADATRGKRKTVRLWAAVFWLLLWQLLSVAIGQKILLVSPIAALLRLGELALTAAFWRAIAFSCVRIMGGFLLAVLMGTLLAGLSAQLAFVRELLFPAILMMKATPVASFIILVLIWIPSRNLAVLISFMMVLPVLYTNLLDGIQSTDRQLLEMAKVFRIPHWRVLRSIYLAQLLPFFRSACSISLGLCWKAGIAAEVIGIPNGSIGEKLYQAKIYLETADLFAWTLVIILMSMLLERLFLHGIDLAVQHLERW
jgi:NitT/TauT family transport system permease protein